MRLFVYGTLMEPTFQEALLDKTYEMAKATLYGYEKVADQDGYLFLKENPKAHVNGAMITLTHEEVKVLNGWENVPEYDLKGVRVVRNLEEVEHYSAFAYMKNDPQEGTPVSMDLLYMKSYDEVMADISKFRKDHAMPHRRRVRCCGE